MISELKNICLLEENIDLKKYNTFKLESKGFCMVFPNDVDELKNVLKVVKKYKSKYFVIGNGSNILLPEFYDGVIINLSKFNKYELKDNYVYAESGCMLNALASKITNLGYAGLDFATGIPGTVGGSIYGNAGCFGSSMSKILETITIFDGKSIKELKNEDMKFEDRSSILKRTNKKWIILSCKMRVEKSNVEELKELVKERTNKRLATQDLSHPSNGSMFKNPVGYAAAGKLIDDLGLKGYKVGDAMVSTIHANFIVNDGHATIDDVLRLVNKIKKDVKEAYGADLVLEQEIIE